MHRRLADVFMQPHRRVDGRLRGAVRADDLDERHQIGRVPPMGADGARAIGDVAHDGGDRDHRGIAGENGVGARHLLDFDEKCPFDVEIFECRLDDEVGVAHGRGDRVMRGDAGGASLVFVQIARDRGDTLAHAVTRGLRGIVDRDLVAAVRENLRDAMAHESGAEDGDAHVRLPWNSSDYGRDALQPPSS